VLTFKKLEVDEKRISSVAAGAPDGTHVAASLQLPPVVETVLIAILFYW